MAKAKFTNTELTRAASGAKRTYLRQAKNGEYIESKLNKTDALNKIATSLKVTSRTLYSESRKEYLDNWYDKLIIEIGAINEKNVALSGVESVNELKDKTMEELREEVTELRTLVNAYKKKVENYQIKIDKLMTKEIKRYEKIDS